MKTVKTILTTLIIGFFAFLTSCQDKAKAELSVKNDTLITKVLNINDKEDLEKNGFYAEENYVIANKTYLRNIPSKSQSKIIDTLDFGDKVYIKSVYYDDEGGGEVIGDESVLENEKKEGYVAVYFKKPKNINDKPNGYMLEKVLTHQYEYNQYKKYFSLPEFKKLDSNIKKIILDNSYLNSKSFYLTESSQKAPNAICSGDYDGDGLKDYAVVLDNVENEHSMVMVFLINSSTKEPYVAYKIEFEEYLKVRSVAKDTEVSLYDPETSEGVPYKSDLDIIEFYGKETKAYLSYDKSTNKIVQK